MPSILFWPPSALFCRRRDRRKPRKKSADQRWQAKQNRDWTEADRLRAEVAALGWIIKDRKDGYDLARK